MIRIQVAGLAAVVVLLTNFVLAQQDLLDEPRQLEQVRFSPPQTASIRLTNGVRRTGKIVSISRESMVYQVGRDNMEVTVEIDDIDRVNTLDQEFSYEPEDEDFERLKIKARRISYLIVETVETYVPPPVGYQPETTPPAEPVRQPDPPAVPDPQPAATPDPDPQPTPDTQSADTESPSTADVDDSPPRPGDLILFCSNCNNRLPLDIKNGEACPHCGEILYNAPPSGGGGGPQARSDGGGSVDPGTGAFPTVAGGGAPAGNGDGDGAAAAASQGGGQVVARGTGLGDLPLWVKVGFFVGILAIGWLLLQRR